MLSIIRWDDYNIELSFTDEDSAPINITWCTIYFTARDFSSINNTNDANVVIKKTITSHINPVWWITELVLSNQETNINPGQYYYDIQMKTIDNKIRSIWKEVLEVVQDITKDPELPITP
jgi:hypothetical protein